MNQAIAETITRYYPDIQAIYLFGSYGRGFERTDSDIDLAVLLPHRTATENRSLGLLSLASALKELAGREVDLINLRTVNTVFQNEIINTGRIIDAADDEQRKIFEMQVLSAYQKLTEERREILESFFRTKRAYNV